jgi:DNA damage-binding protein 1
MNSSNNYQSSLLPCLDCNYGSIQQAYNKRDGNSSKLHHDNKGSKSNNEDYHKVFGGDVVKSIVFGGLDGIITTFAVITSAYANSLAGKIVLILGFSNVLADAISMGHGDYFSEKAEHDYVQAQYEREKWEMDNYMEGEINEMVELYQRKYKIPEAEARLILSKMAEYPNLFLDHMMVIELEMMPPDPDTNPVKNGIVTFLSFLLFGSVPLIFYAINRDIILSCCAAILSLSLLGYIRASFTRGNRLWNIFVTVTNGCFSATAAYLVSYLLTNYS